jgi:hypothetical protein
MGGNDLQYSPRGGGAPCQVRHLQLSPRLTNHRIVKYSWWLSRY